MRMNLGATRFMPGLGDYLYFPQLRSNRSAVNKEILRTVFDDCIAARDVSGAFMVIVVNESTSLIQLIFVN